MTLYMSELVVSDFATSLAWYQDILGLRVKHLDAANQFVLFDAGVALKGGVPKPGSVTLHFLVTDLDAERLRLTAHGAIPAPTKTSTEGYRETFITDPDGYRLGLFEFAQRIA